MNGWTDRQVDSSELIATDLFYVDPNVHSHSYFIQCDIGLFLKSSKKYDSRVLAMLVSYESLMGMG